MKTNWVLKKSKSNIQATLSTAFLITLTKYLVVTVSESVKKE